MGKGAATVSSSAASESIASFAPIKAKGTRKEGAQANGSGPQGGYRCVSVSAQIVLGALERMVRVVWWFCEDTAMFA